MKKTFALLLAVIMVISMAACAPADDSTTTTTAAASTTTAAKDTTVASTTTAPVNDGSYDLTGIASDDVINIGIRVNSAVLDYDDNAFTLWLEEQTGLDIQFTFFSSDAGEARQQLNLMVANKEKLPDVILGTLDEAQIAEYGSAGLLADLTPYFESSSYYFKRVVDTMSDYEENYMWARVTDATTGKIFVFPTTFVNVGNDSSGFIGAINATMAEKVGMVATEIDTIDEVYEYLTKTIKGDGNGNGKADEIGILYMPNGYRSGLDQWIINAYVYCLDDYLYNATDGEVWVPYNTDEYRQAMITMNKWFSEGLISSLSFSLKQDAEFTAVVDVEPENYITPIWGFHPTLLCSKESPIGDHYSYTPTLADETGKGGYVCLRDKYGLYKYCVIPANEKNPERVELAFRFCDLFAHYETRIRARYGEQGVNWDYLNGEAEGKKDVYGNWAGMTVINDEWGKETRATWNNNVLYCQSSGGVAAGIDIGHVWLNPVASSSRTYISRGNLADKLAGEQPAEIVYALLYNTEEYEAVAEYETLYKEYVQQARAEMITGVIDPNDDAQWAKYLSELKANGEDELVEAAQSAYERMQ